MIGRTLGNYRIVEQIGMGGMATVYKAYDPDTDRYVALKILPEHYSKDPAFQERFRREAKAIARLEHIHILPVHAYGEQDGISYLVMRLMETGTLSDRIKRGSLPLDEASRLLSQIASALDYAHSQGVIHRDIKPSNILLDRNNNAFLTDFGIAKMIEGTGIDLTGTGIIGTPQYMSPEQCRGEKNLTPASDIYSLGVVVYEMVTGHAPFQAETPLAVIHMQLNEPLPPARSLRPDISDAVEGVIFKALAKQPESRYPSCVAMANAFTKAVSEMAERRAADDQLDKATITASTEPTREARDSKTEALRPAKRRPLWPVIAGIAIVGLVGAALVLGILSNSAADSTITETAAALAEAASDTPTVEPSEIPPPTDTPDLRGAAQATNAVEATINAERTALFFEGQTAEATLWTATPLATDTPTDTPVPTITETLAPPLEVLMEQGDAQVEGGDLQAALASFTQAVEQYPDSAWAYHNRGWVYYDQGDYDRAIADFEQTLSLDPDYPSAYLGMGYSYYEQQDYDQAIASFDSLIEREPSAEAYLARGYAHNDSGQHEAAIADFTQAVTLDENYLDAYEVLGDTYDSLGQHAEALDAYQQYVEHAGDNAAGYVIERIAELETLLAETGAPVFVVGMVNARSTFVLEVRSGLETDSQAIGVASAGERLPIIGISPDGNYYRVEYNGQVGWIYAFASGEVEGDLSSLESSEVIAPAYIEGGRLFYDDFEDGDTERWLLHERATVALDSGNHVLRMIAFHGNDYVFAGTGSVRWQNYALEFRVRVAGTAVASNRFVVGANVRGDVERDGCNRYFIGFEEWGTYIERLGEEDTCPLVTLAETPDLTITPGDWHTVRIEVYDAHLSVYIDGDLALSFVDDEPLAHGYIGLAAGRGTTAHFDEVRVIALVPADGRPTGGVPAVLTANANLRDGPGVDFGLVRGAAQGERLTVTARNARGTWLRVVTASGDTAWVLAARVELQGRLADVPVVNR